MLKTSSHILGDVPLHLLDISDLFAAFLSPFVGWLAYVKVGRYNLIIKFGSLRLRDTDNSKGRGLGNNFS